MTETAQLTPAPEQPAWAEVDRVWVHDRHIEITGRVAAPSAAPRSARLFAAVRRTTRSVSTATTIDGGRFVASLELSALEPGSEAAEPWDLWLEIEGGPRLRLGAPTDGVTNRAKAVSFPARVLDTSSGRRRVRPYWTRGNELSISSKPVDPADREPARPSSLRGAPPRPLPRLSTRGTLAHRIARAALRAVMTVAPRGRRGDGDRVSILVFEAWAVGGTVRTVMNLAGFLADRRDVEVVSVVRRHKQLFFDPPRGARLTTLDDQRPETARRRRGRRERLRRLLSERPSLLLHPDDLMTDRCSLATDLQLVRALWRIRSGTVMATRPSLNLLIAGCTRRGVRAIGWEHKHLTAHSDQLQKDMRRRYRRLDALVTLTERDAQDYGRHMSDDTPVVAIPNAVPPVAGPRSPLTGRVIMGIGRLRRQKGFDRLIDAFARVMPDHPDWVVWICGEGNGRPHLRRRIYARGVYNHVYLLGSVNDVDRRMEQASMFALSSRSEGFPMVLLEAMAKGLPVVSFDCPTGPGELVRTGTNGILVPDGDIEGMADGLRTLIEDEEGRRRCADGAIAAAQAYKMEAVGPRWERLIERVS